MEQPKHFFDVRPLKEEDFNYVLATWSKGILGEPPFRWMSDAAWKKHHALMEKRVSTDTVLVAVNPDDEDHILGYIVFDISPAAIPVIHWCYVKKQFRGRGMGATLLKEVRSKTTNGALIYTHQCKASKDKAPELGAEYDPFYVWT